MRPDSLAFDLDGTLWDAAAASAFGWNAALEALGVSTRVTVDDIRSVSGNPFDRCVHILLPEHGPLSDEAVRSIEAQERVGIEAMAGVLYPGVRGGLVRLAAVYPLFVVSNCPDWYLAEFFRVTGLQGYFTAWDCHGASGSGKAYMLLDLRRRADLVHPVYVGDTEGDRIAAEKAGMGFAFARYGFGRVEAADPAFDRFDDLVDHFLGRI